MNSHHSIHRFKDCINTVNHALKQFHYRSEVKLASRIINKLSFHSHLSNCIAQLVMNDCHSSVCSINAFILQWDWFNKWSVIQLVICLKGFDRTISDTPLMWWAYEHIKQSICMIISSSHQSNWSIGLIASNALNWSVHSLRQSWIYTCLSIHLLHHINQQHRLSCSWSASSSVNQKSSSISLQHSLSAHFVLLLILSIIRRRVYPKMCTAGHSTRVTTPAVIFVTAVSSAKS